MEENTFREHVSQKSLMVNLSGMEIDPTKKEMNRLKKEIDPTKKEMDCTKIEIDPTKKEIDCAKM
ncbi:hypothetical protein [Marinifilum flexuosum]|uniref:hypothetical protein n=1 Tax=Marinifilum flexuosum TaxID=1117708 RepID=UPI0024945245|nr:hypothetical protein [Marinifilum flexuosum]